MGAIKSWGALVGVIWGHFYNSSLMIMMMVMVIIITTVYWMLILCQTLWEVLKVTNSQKTYEEALLLLSSLFSNEKIEL